MLKINYMLLFSEIVGNDLVLEPLFKDPRLSSKKYIEVLDNKSIVHIITNTGKDIDLKYIQYYTTHQDSYPTPKNCVDLDENHINEIYKDIDKEIQNTSVESGELFENEEFDIQDFRKKNDKVVKKQDKSQLDNKIHKKYESMASMNKPHNSSPTKGVPDFLDRMPVFNNYKIPKIKDKHEDYYINKKHVPFNSDLDDISDINASEGDKNIDSMVTSNSSCTNNKNILLQSSNLVSERGNEIALDKDADFNTSDRVRQFVADDLALSDETNDYHDITDMCSTTSKEGTSPHVENTEKANDIKSICTNTKNISSKFAELFGDSLITPEDLELNASNKSNDMDCINETSVAIKIQDEIPSLIENEGSHNEIKETPKQSKKKKESGKKNGKKSNSKKKDNTDNKLPNIEINEKPVTTNVKNQEEAVCEKMKVIDESDIDNTMPPESDADTDARDIPVPENISNNKNAQSSSDELKDNFNISSNDFLTSTSGVLDTPPVQSVNTGGAGAHSTPEPPAQTPPDVRIVLKRRRKIMRKSNPAVATT